MSLQVSFARAAEFRLAPDSVSEDSSVIILEGAIEVGDFEKFKAIFENQNAQNVVVSAAILNSPGGAVVPALEIGRYIRQKRLVTYSPLSCEESECICASACSLIWLGGIARTGTVYVHRPSLGKENRRVDFDAWNLAVSNAEDDIKSYLEEMRIAENVSKALFSTSPEDISPIRAGKDVAYKDSILDDFSRTQCGPPMSEFQDFYLSSFEGSDGQSDESELGVTERELLSVLREKASWLRECNKNILYIAQEKAQLGR